MLPQQFRPTEQYNFVAIGETEATATFIPIYVRVLPAGNVALFYNTVPSFLCIDGVSFFID